MGHLRAINPDDSVPTCTIKCDKDVDHDDCNVSACGLVTITSWFSNCDEAADVEHSKSGTNPTYDEKLSSAKSIEDPYERNNSSAHLDDSVDTRCEKTGGCAGNTETLEDYRAVVVNGVNSGQVLAHHHAHTNGKTIANALHAKFLELSKKIGTVSPFRLMFELCAHLMHFVVDIFVVCGKIANICEIGEGFLPLPGFSEPPWAFFAEKHSEKKDAAWHKLKGKWDNPLSCRWSNVLVETIGYPKCKYGSHLDFPGLVFVQRCGEVHKISKNPTIRPLIAGGLAN